MQVDGTLIHRALTHARHVAEFYAELPAPFSGQKTPDSLLYICRQYIKKKVQIYGVSATARSVRAYYEAVADGYNVYVLEPQETLWRDFAACKELFHVILDDPDSEDCRTVNLYEHLEEVVDTFIPFDGAPGKAATSEFLAELAAMEFLFPYAERIKIKSEEALPDVIAIAKHFNLPIAMIERYLSPGYFDPLKEFHQQ